VPVQLNGSADTVQLKAYFRARKEFSSGVIEGLNNKAKITMRKSSGFRTFRVTDLPLYYSLGKLPRPELTLRFF
jgi:transposase